MEQRLWHKDLLPLLPDNFIVNQLSDCVDIAESLMYKGIGPNEITERVSNFMPDEFYTFYRIVREEAIKRKLYETIDLESFDKKFMENMIQFAGRDNFTEVNRKFLYQGWFTTRYLQQCILSLEELYDNSKISLKDWFKIVNGIRNNSQLCEDTYESLFT